MVELSSKARAFLREKRFAVLGTINPDSTPQLSAMWYELDGDKILMNTKVGRVKERNLRRDPRISICIEDGYNYLTLAGTAQLIDDQSKRLCTLRGRRPRPSPWKWKTFPVSWIR